MAKATPVPVTVLTGFLGSGKTTLLNHILTANHGKRIAVIENEFGEINIDKDFVVHADEEIFEMNNGCICCTVRGDLIRILGNLMKRRDKFDYILVETTGMADPGPVAQTFFADDEIRAKTTLDGIVTLVDAKHVSLHFDSHEVQEQIAFADVILLNKCDLVEPAELDALETKLKRMNRAAKVIRSTNSIVPMDAVLNVGGFNLERILEHEPEFLGSSAVKSLEMHDHDEEHCDDPTHDHSQHDHTHDVSVGSVGIVVPGDVDAKRMNAWISKLLQEKGQDIFRMKGVLSIRNDPKRFAFQGVHMQFDGRALSPWKPGEERTNKLVFIGRDLNRAELEGGFRKCLVH